MECKYCKSGCYKKGIRYGSQQYQCKECRKYQKKDYRYLSYSISDEVIKKHVKEGVGIRSTARLLGIGQNTVLRRIRKIAEAICKPAISKKKFLKSMSCVHLLVPNPGASGL